MTMSVTTASPSPSHQQPRVDEEAARRSTGNRRGETGLQSILVVRPPVSHVLRQWTRYRAPSPIPATPISKVQRVKRGLPAGGQRGRTASTCCPGTYHNPRIKGQPKLIVYQSRFILGGQGLLARPGARHRTVK